MNAKILIRAGYIHKTMAGVYSFLPLGLRSLNKIIEIIREEMDGIGGQEILLNGLQNPEVWERSGRWRGDTDEVWFRTQLRVGGELGLGWTHEEPITELARQHCNSYRDVPFYLYQFQTKFRNEERAKSGILRTREFIMKDLYSFCASEEQHKVFYEQCAEAYQRVFQRVGIGDGTYRTFASGGAFSEFSDEFQTVLPAGEDIIYVHKERGVALNKEVYTDAVLERLELRREELEEHPACEVGNIFTLGTRFSEALELRYADSDGAQVPVFMGSYGIGPARLLGVAVEKFGAEDKLVLPPAIAPFRAHLITLGNDETVKKTADTLYQQMTERGTDVLYDDRDLSAGEKFAENDIIGIPHRFVVSEKTCAEEKVEYSNRISEKKACWTTPLKGCWKRYHNYMHRFIAIDVESTGVDFCSSQVIQCAAIFLDEKTQPTGSREWNINYAPEKFSWDTEAEEVHGISAEQAKKHGVAPEVFLKEFEQEIVRRYGITEDIELHTIAANAHFDYLMLQRLWDTYRSDTALPLSRRVMDITALSLAALGVAGMSTTLETLGIEEEEDKRHSALYDTELHLKVFHALLAVLQKEGTAL